jgi:hypothetical protein
VRVQGCERQQRHDPAANCPGDQAPQSNIHPPSGCCPSSSWSRAASIWSSVKRVRLRRPGRSDSKVRPWKEAVLHVSSEAVVPGLNVLGFVHLERHFARLARSASLLHIPMPLSYEDFEGACFAP